MPVFLTLLPQARNDLAIISGQQRKPRLAARHGNCTPPRISPSCPHCVELWLGRSTNAGAVIARQVGHGLLSGRTDPLTTFLAALMQRNCTGGSSRVSPMSLANSLSLHGTPADVFPLLDMYLRRFRTDFLWLLKKPLTIYPDSKDCSEKNRKNFQ